MKPASRPLQPEQETLKSILPYVKMGGKGIDEVDNQLSGVNLQIVNEQAIFQRR